MSDRFKDLYYFNNTVDELAYKLQMSYLKQLSQNTGKFIKWVAYFTHVVHLENYIVISNVRPKIYRCVFCLVSLFNAISTLEGYLML